MANPDIKKFPTNTAGKLYFGKWPSVETLRKLQALKVDVIWNLANELKVLIPFETHFIPTVIHGDIEDFGIPENIGAFLGQVKQIASLLASGKNVFVHCWSSIGRTGLALSSLEVVLNHSKPDVALAKAHSTCGGPETEAQKQFVRSFYDHINGSTKKKTTAPVKNVPTKK